MTSSARRSGGGRMRGIELTPEEPIDAVVELGQVAETVGFDTVFASCHYNNRDPFISLDRIAAATDTVRIGPGVANPYETHPVALASRLATLWEVSGGRAVFGVGAGDRSTLANLGVEREEPLARVAETVEVARRLWAGERVDHDGTFSARDAGLNYPAGEIPVYVGAQGPSMLRMAAEVADGVLVNAAHPRDVAWARRRIDEGLERRPQKRGALEVVIHASLSVSDDPVAARDAARPPVAFIAGGASAATLERHDIDAEVAGEIGRLIGGGEFREAFAAVTDGMLEAFCGAGTPDDAAERIDALLEHADGVVAGAPLGPSRRAAVELLGAAFDHADRR